MLHVPAIIILLSRKVILVLRVEGSVSSAAASPTASFLFALCPCRAKFLFMLLFFFLLAIACLLLYPRLFAARLALAIGGKEEVSASARSGRPDRGGPAWPLTAVRSQFPIMLACMILGMCSCSFSFACL